MPRCAPIRPDQQGRILGETLAPIHHERAGAPAADAGLIEPKADGFGQYVCAEIGYREPRAAKDTSEGQGTPGRARGQFGGRIGAVPVSTMALNGTRPPQSAMWSRINGMP